MLEVSCNVHNGLFELCFAFGVLARFRISTPRVDKRPVFAAHRVDLIRCCLDIILVLFEPSNFRRTQDLTEQRIPLLNLFNTAIALNDDNVEPVGESRPEVVFVEAFSFFTNPVDHCVSKWIFVVDFALLSLRVAVDKVDNRVKLPFPRRDAGHWFAPDIAFGVFGEH